MSWRDHPKGWKVSLHAKSTNGFPAKMSKKYVTVKIRLLYQY